MGIVQFCKNRYGGFRQKWIHEGKKHSLWSQRVMVSQPMINELINQLSKNYAFDKRLDKSVMYMLTSKNPKVRAKAIKIIEKYRGNLNECINQLRKVGGNLLKTSNEELLNPESLILNRQVAGSATISYDLKGALMYLYDELTGADIEHDRLDELLGDPNNRMFLIDMLKHTPPKSQPSLLETYFSLNSNTPELKPTKNQYKTPTPTPTSI